MTTAARIVDLVNEVECYTPKTKTVTVRGNIPVQLSLDARGHLTVTCGDERTSGDWSQVYWRLSANWRGKYLSAIRRSITMLIRAA